jgi:hypothetical protein
MLMCGVLVFFVPFAYSKLPKLRNILFILIVAILTVLVLLFISNPEILDKIWLWLIGFEGGVIGLFRAAYEWIANLFKKKDDKTGSPDNTTTHEAVAHNEIVNAQKATTEKLDNLTRKLEEKGITSLNTPFNGTTITLLRYVDDGEASLGLLFFRNEFFAYVLEDAFHEVKIKEQTRIPAGEYMIAFNETLTDLTHTYRNKFSWFTWHIEVKNVPNYDGIYIHIGNKSADTAGCLLIADGINAASPQKSLIYSTQAFERFYKKMKSLLDTGEKIRIVIHNENWFPKINLQNM